MRAKKSLGQNFLVDPHIQQGIVRALALDTGEQVLEIGPGQGALTRHLAAEPIRLVAVERDHELAAALSLEFRDRANVEIIHGDALELRPADHFDDPSALKVVGNIPYNITTPLIFWLLERDHRPALIVLMVQREVAERILAPAGGREYGALSVGVRAVARVEKLFHVRPGAFRPIPNVESTVLRIVPDHPPPLRVAEEASLRVLTRTAFSQRRKQLQGILRKAPEYRLETPAVVRLLEGHGIPPTARPEDLTPEQFVALARALPATETA